MPYKNCKGGYNEYEEPFYTDKIRQLIIKTISDNLEGYDRVAVWFNGDVESFTILCCAKKFNPHCEIMAFISDDLCDEKAEKVIKDMGIELVKVSRNSQQICPHIAAQYDVMAMAKQYGFDVLIDCLGANELFAGYTYYLLPFLKSLRSQWMFRDWIRELWHVHNTASLKEIILQRLKTLRVMPFQGKKKSTTKNKSVLNDYLYEDYTNSLPNTLRCGEDLAASFGVKYLNPFANGRDLAEYVFSVPSTFKIHNGWNKYLLRAAMIGIVDDEILWKKRLKEK